MQSQVWRKASSQARVGAVLPTRHFLAIRPQSRPTRIQAASDGSPGVVKKTVVDDLAKYYHEVQHPALANRSYSEAIMDFTAAAILAYECGYDETGLRMELLKVLESSDDPLLQSLKDLDGGESVLLFTSLVWITLSLCPGGSRNRWVKSSAVSEHTMAQWKGFATMIVNGWFEQRMAWYSVDRLSMEIAAVVGRTEAPDLVAERARLVYTVLEMKYPQFPKD